MEDIRVYTGTLVLDLTQPYATGLKERRKDLHSLKDRLRNKDFAVAQVGPADLRQRAFVAVTAVAGNASVLDERLDLAERLAFASDFEVTILSRDTVGWSGSSLAGC